ncbi:MAG: flavin oxidoreductase/NADH oxidase [Oscillospiraceae bacterium]|nr:flavin oxidoreductase/NADH oxidase [Oscillospiraceae bacterium]
MNPRFSYNTKQDLADALSALGLEMAYSDNAGVLAEPLKIGSMTIPNRIAYQPMEGCDGNTDGSPGELTERRYRRFAEGGAGLIWLEAVAIAENARANPRQLWIHEKNKDSFKVLIENIKKICYDKNGYSPVVIVQLTHSGRYSKPNGIPEPIIAYNNPIFEGDNPISEDCIITDDQCGVLEQDFGRAVRLAAECGADGADIKCCHRYLLSEFLSAFTRKGQYGGSFDNRTRLFRNAVSAAKANSGTMLVTSRLNAYDGFPYPYGFGVSPQDSGITPDLTETLELVRILHDHHKFSLINITAGNPYVNSNVNRPADVARFLDIEHPLIGAERILGFAGTVQRAFPDCAVISSGLSYLRHHGANIAAAMIERGDCAMAGFGRLTFAYPDCAADIIGTGGLNPAKCCIACGKCTEIMRGGGQAGCPVRDSAVYAEILRMSRCIMLSPSR